MPEALAVDESNPHEGWIEAPISSPATSASSSGASTRDPPNDGACPDGMVHVEVDYCSNQKTRCLHESVEKNNHFHICHEFAPPVTCSSTTKHLSFCMDRYEYPNRAGAHPVMHANWYDAASTCNSVGKRMCWESEWTAACEGPEHLPFPYGWARDTKSCNIGRPFDLPYNDRMYSKNPDVQRKELDRLDRSVRSGSMPGCVSGFGIHDMTGNVDEWVNNEAREAGGLWSTLKGGGYIMARNACRPRTSSHEPHFRFYTLGVRCCSDVLPREGSNATTSSSSPLPDPSTMSTGSRPQSLISPVMGFRAPRVPDPAKDHWPEWKGRVLPLWE